MKLIKKRFAKAAGLARYFTGKPCPRGHIAERSVATGQCTQCDRERSAARRAQDPERHKEAVRKSAAKKAANENRQRIKLDEEAKKAKRKAYREKNKDRINEQQRAKRLADPDRFKQYQGKWLSKNAEALNEKKRRRAAEDPVYAFTRRARCLIRGAIARAGFKKAKKTEQLLGCTIEQFRLQIERQFLPGMGWHNMHLWHIDHIVPVSSATSIEEAEALNMAGNLRPFWGSDNKKKSAKQTHLL